MAPHIARPLGAFIRIAPLCGACAGVCLKHPFIWRGPLLLQSCERGSVTLRMKGGDESALKKARLHGGLFCRVPRGKPRPLAAKASRWRVSPAQLGTRGAAPEGESARRPRSGHFAQQSGKGDWPDAQRLPAG